MPPMLGDVPPIMPPTPKTEQRVTLQTRRTASAPFGSDIEGRIEKNPLTAVVVAGVAGLLMGMLSRSL